MSGAERKPVNGTLFQKVCDAVSTERLQPFFRTCDGRLEHALRLYAWNIEISSAFHGPLHCLEVVLRNALNRELTTLLHRSDWWHAPALDLDASARRSVLQACATVAQNYTSPTNGHVIAELSFGFWTSLLGTGNRYDMRLWRPALHRAFPHYRGPRRALHQDLYHLRKPRNRIAHYEPVHQRHLAADHATILRVLGYLSPEMAQWVRANDRVSEVLGRRGDVCAAAVPTRF
ncbi:hypothetical protein Psi01_24310 [Planobispora siamensis]|uniref:Abi-like protein n=1 Tax=Planobispora siamensis TaxID=936338 RepID=A0A8J3WLG3_9ACTN|nr:hypothetical protein [Planobispora siamensis]GIH91801.1 hypothetical protein Psi01_24310 [Planobispora siamensis]